MSAHKLNFFKAIDFLIRVESGPDAGKAYKIQPPHITIGRDSQCQITLTDPKVSRKQVMIKFDHSITCVDLSSRKTTLLNGSPAHNQALKPGDTLSFGNTSLKFLTKTNPNAQPQLSGNIKRPENKEKEAAKKRFTFFIVTIAVLASLLYFLDSNPVAQNSQKLISQEEVNKQIEESRERTSLLRESYNEKKKLSDKNYMYNVEKHFISGFRDFQNGQYGRAIDSFGTTIATDQSHVKAQQYSRTARKKREDLIDTHMRDGVKYREKLMYNRCAAEFEKAIILINDQNSKKYELALTQLKECRLLKTGRY